MKIITLNCCLSPWILRRKRRLPYIVKELVKEKPDIIFLQEIFFKSDSNYLIKNLLERGFVDYFYSKSLLIVSKHPLVSRNYCDFKLCYNNGFIAYIYKALNLFYSHGYQVVESVIEEQKILFLHTHLFSARGKDYGVYRKERLEELIEVCEFLKSKKSKQIIFGGDFNFDLDSSSYKIAVNRYKFNDPLHKTKGNTISSNNLNRKSRFLIKMDQRLDYIFIKSFEKNKKQGRIIFKEPLSTAKGRIHISDHYGLSLNID